MNEQVDTVFFGEAGNELGFVFEDPACQIIGDADVERSVLWLARM
jgi:hypothetical protein